MRRTHRLCGIILPFLLFLIVAGCGSGGSRDSIESTRVRTPVRYEVVDVEGRLPSAIDLNDQGEILGFELEYDVYEIPILLRGDTLIYLSDKERFFSDEKRFRPAALNNRGQVVGERFLWQEGTVTDLRTLDPLFGVATDINDSGVITGWTTLPAANLEAPRQVRAFVWRDGQMQILDNLENLDALPHAINNRGQVVGWAVIEGRSRSNRPGNSRTSPPVYSLITGVLWENGKIQVLRSADGRAFRPVHSTSAINDDGVIAGGLETTEGTTAAALLLPGGEVIDFTTLSEEIRPTFTHSVNNHGQAIGTGIGDASSGNSFLFSEGKVLSLRRMIDTASGWELQAVHTINDNGYILGLGRYRQEPNPRSILLAPVFE